MKLIEERRFAIVEMSNVSQSPRFFRLALTHIGIATGLL